MALQESVPIGKLAPGRYKLTVMIDDTQSDDTFDIRTEFMIE